MQQVAIFIYQITVLLYGLGIRIVAIFSPKARLWINGRKNIFTQLAGAFKAENAPIIWIHCASLGEFEQGRPLIEQLKANYPHYKILLTFFSPSGYEIRKDYPLADYIFYLPLDTPKNAIQFLAITQPTLVFFVKYEFWYFYLKTLQKRKIKHFLIAGTFRKGQFFFKKYAKWYLRAIQDFDYLFLQEESSKNLLAQHHIHNCEVAGDSRIDRVLAIASEAPEIPLIQQFKADRKLLILGSAHPKDLRLFFDALAKILTKNYYENWCFLIAPHEIEEQHIQQIEAWSPITSYRFSEIEPPVLNREAAILILNTIGQLSTAYQYADAVFIGGGFDKSIHNILEPAVFGIPIAFGPNYYRFVEAIELVNNKGALSIQSINEFIDWLEQLQTETYRTETGNICRTYTWQNRGATKKIINYLNKKNVLKLI